LIEEVNGEHRKKTVRRKRTHTLTVLPRELHLDGNLNVEKRAYGLHETAVFEMQGAVTGSFAMPGVAGLPTLGQNAHLTWGHRLFRWASRMRAASRRTKDPTRRKQLSSAAAPKSPV